MNVQLPLVESNGQQSLQIVIPVVVVGIVLSALGVVIVLWCILMRQWKQQPKKSVHELERQERELSTNSAVTDRGLGYVNKGLDLTYEQMVCYVD